MPYLLAIHKEYKSIFCFFHLGGVSNATAEVQLLARWLEFTVPNSAEQQQTQRCRRAHHTRCYTTMTDNRQTANWVAFYTGMLWHLRTLTNGHDTVQLFQHLLLLITD